MFTVLWCYLRNPEFKKGDIDYHVAADLTGQANHIGVTIEADIIKQKLPRTTAATSRSRATARRSNLVYEELTTDHPIDLCRWQVANCYLGRIGLINSGGESKGASDLADAVYTAVINKRAGGTGLISGRKAFQRPMSEGVELLNAIQDVYLDERDHRRLIDDTTEAARSSAWLSSPSSWCRQASPSSMTTVVKSVNSGVGSTPGAHTAITCWAPSAPAAYPSASSDEVLGRAVSSFNGSSTTTAIARVGRVSSAVRTSERRSRG